MSNQISFVALAALGIAVVPMLRALLLAFFRFVLLFAVLLAVVESSSGQGGTARIEGSFDRVERLLAGRGSEWLKSSQEWWTATGMRVIADGETTRDRGQDCRKGAHRRADDWHKRVGEVHAAC